MTTITQTYPKDTAGTAGVATRERAGGPHGNQPETASEFAGYFMSNKAAGSHMPLDTQIHWDWRNPLNIIPAFIALLFILTVIGLLVQ